MKDSIDEGAAKLNATLGANAMAIREALGLSLREATALAAAVGYDVDYGYWARLERGKTGWNMRAIYGVSLAYGVEPEALFLPHDEQALIQMVRSGGPTAAISWARMRLGV